MNNLRVLATQLRLGELSFDEVLEQFDPDAAGSYELGAVLAERATGDEIGRLLDLVQGSRAHWIVAITLLERGYADLVLRHDWSASALIGFGAEATRREIESDSLFRGVEREVAEAIAGEELGELQALGVKHFLHRFSPSAQRDVMAWLDPRVQAGIDADLYLELDYAYGQVDPAVELALCHVRSGGFDRATELLQQRHDKWPKMMHTEELLDLAAICEQMPPGARATWWTRFREWARATDELTGTSEGPWLDLEWLARAPGGGDREEEIVSMIAQANTDAVKMLLEARPDDSRIRPPAIARLLDLLTAHVDTLGSADATERAWSVRGVRTAATALDCVADELSARQRLRVGEDARGWANWFASREEIGDSLPPVYTAIAFAGTWFDDIEPAVARIRAWVDADRDVLGYDGVERLLPS